jgi:hypothetical protein
MNIPPILERLLLSNEAVFKNASLGMNSLNMLYVPEGKTAVILGYEINAFCNAVVDGAIWNAGYDDGTLYTSLYSGLIQHINYQMQIVNDSYFTAFTHSPDFSTQAIQKTTDPPNPYLSLQFKSKSQPLFIYVDRSTYFQLVFQDFETFLPYYGLYAGTFETNIQNISGVPITYKGSAVNRNYYSYLAATTPFPAGQEQYNPTGKGQINAALYGSYNLPNGEQEYLRYGTNTNLAGLLNPFSAMPAPPDQPDPVTAANMFVMPTINVQYALINKRASDYGIVAGKV